MTVTEMSIGYVRFNPNPVDASSPTLVSVQTLETELTWSQVSAYTWGQMQSKTW